MQPDAGTTTRNPIGRRAFLKGAGAGTLVAASPLPEWFLRSGMVAALVERDGLLTATLYRPEDQLRLRFEFPGLVYESATNELVASGVGTPMVRIIHPAQHLSEQPIPSVATPGTTSIEHRIGGPSRLVFQVDPPIPFTVASLLSLGVLTKADGAPQTLTDSVSMVEVPADLRLSPEAVAPVSDLAPVTFGSVTQLHRTILTSNGPIEVDVIENARVIDGFTGRVPNAAQRTSIANASRANGPATARRLWLTPHGAWADLRGSWPLLDWIQTTVGGRDHFVEIVETGALLPFGLPVTWVTTTAREWRVDTLGGVVAALTVSTKIVVLDDTVTYDAETLPFGGRAWPFRSVSAVLEGALEGDKQQIQLIDGTSLSTDVAWKIVQQTQFGPWHRFFAYRAVDLAGQELEFSLPGVFVTADGMANPGVRERLEDFYRDGSTEPSDLDWYTRIRSRGPVAFAPEEEPGSGRTTLNVTEIRLGVTLPEPGPGSPPSGAAPAIDSATVNVPAEIQQGIDGVPVPTLEVSYPDRWLEHGADPGAPGEPKNPDLGYLDVAVPPEVELGGTARAVMTPDVVAESFNQEYGFGARPDLTPGNPPVWSPEQAFGPDAEILKGVKLRDLVDVVDLFDAIPGIEIPTLRIDFFPINIPDKIEYTYEWCPTDIKSDELAGFIARDTTRLCVTMTTVVGLKPSIPSGGGVEFEVSDFTLQIPPSLGVIELDVAELRASQPIGGSFGFTLDIDRWRLGGLLDWLQPLVRGLSPRGDAFAVDLRRDSIDLDLTLPVPNINLGLLSIRNLAIGIGGDFPFSGPRDPLVRFTAGTRKAPITVTLLQFTGAFSCELDFTTQGLDRIRAKVEVEACLFRVDVVIAKASFTIGVLLDFRLRNGEVTFEGEVFVEASFSVLGITATVTLAATVSYRSATQKAVARGEIRWEVSSLLGSADGTIPLGSLEFELGSGASVQGFRRASKRAVRARSTNGELPPPGRGFGDQHTFDTWTAYRTTFAAA